ncbi:MAG: Crp/Fnr family transcriptional regulator [Bacteroidetes bacterium]|nr:Crp/Fnr family transcriptional regulator [Bacteroidota bacterium]
MESQLQQEFPNFQKELILDIIKHAVIKEYTVGSVLMRTGQYIKSTILVTKGKIKIYREDDDGNEFFMYYLMPGQACAISMICAIKQETSQIMAKVVEDAEVVMIPLQQMESFMSQHKSWYAFVVETYRNRFEELLLVVDQIAFRSMDERLEFYLKRNATTNNTTLINTSHQEIATDLSSSREVISRLLKKMEQRGLVKLHRNSIELLH